MFARMTGISIRPGGCVETNATNDDGEMRRHAVLVPVTWCCQSYAVLARAECCALPLESPNSSMLSLHAIPIQGLVVAVLHIIVTIVATTPTAAAIGAEGNVAAVVAAAAGGRRCRYARSSFVVRRSSFVVRQSGEQQIH